MASKSLRPRLDLDAGQICADFAGWRSTGLSVQTVVTRYVAKTFAAGNLLLGVDPAHLSNPTPADVQEIMLSMTGLTCRLAESCLRVRNLRAGWPRYAFHRLRERYLPHSNSNSLYELVTPDCPGPLWARPGTSDIHVFRQIFADREYRPFDTLDRRTTGLIIDAGANVGYSSAYFLNRFPMCQGIAVEPDPENSRMLRRNLEPFSDRVRILEAAIWPESRSLVIDKTPYRDGAHWSRRVRTPVASDTQTVNGVDVNTLFQESGHARIWILKIDIERAERELFSTNCSAWLSRVENLVIELHDQECADVFYQAIADQRFSILQCGELTFCSRLAVPVK